MKGTLGWLFKRRDLGLGKWPPVVFILIALYVWAATDAIPDWTPFIGYADDLFVAVGLLVMSRGKVS